MTTELSEYELARAKYVDDEPLDHLLAKHRIGEVGRQHNYEPYYEYPIRVPEHKDVEDVTFPIDVYLVSRTCPDTDIIAVQVDGEIHRHSEIQQGRTQNRDDTLTEYFAKEGVRYVVFNHPNVIEDINKEYSDLQLAEMLGLRL